MASNDEAAAASPQLDQQSYPSLPTNFQTTFQEIHQHLKSSNYDAARQLIDSAFEIELSSGQNDPGRRSALLLFRAIVGAKQGRLEDAVEDLEEYRRLKQTLPGEGSFFMGAMTGFMRRSFVWVLEMEKKSKAHRETRLVPCGGCYKRSGTRRCLGCLYVMYCSAECQKGHWGVHKLVCKSFGSGWGL